MTEPVRTDADLLAERAEADAAEAEAAAAAAHARARALRLRQQAGAATNDTSDVAEETGGDEIAEPEGGTEPNRPAGIRRLGVRLPRPRWTTIAAMVALLCTAALLAAGGFMTWDHRKTLRSENNRAEFTAAARQVVVTLMSIDFNDAKADVQRIIDNSTGAFRDEFSHASEDFIKLAQDAKVTTEATASAAAVESMTDDSAVVLVAASSTVTNAAGAKDAPRNWRLSVDLLRDGDQIKMSKVEFVP